ncbi:unnamed protein product [Diamesa serratosioi]
MNLIEFILAALTVIASIVVVIFVCFLGWYLVWKLFLSRFKLVRELLGQFTESAGKKEATVESKTKTRKIRRE